MAEPITGTIQAIAEASKEAIRFFDKLFGPMAKEVGEILGNEVSLIKLRHLLSVRDRYETLIRKRGLEGKTKNLPKALLPRFVDAVSLEGDEVIQEMWARLLANASDPGQNLDLNKLLISLLKELEPIDVKILDYFSRQGWRQVREVEGISSENIGSELGIDESILTTSLHNLARLQLIGSVRGATWGTIDVGLGVGDPHSTFYMTSLGNQLVEACRD